MTVHASPSEPVELLTLDEASAALRISEATLFRHMRQGTVSVVRIGRRTFIEQSEIRRLVEAGRMTASGASP